MDSVLLGPRQAGAGSDRGNGLHGGPGHDIAKKNTTRDLHADRDFRPVRIERPGRLPLGARIFAGAVGLPVGHRPTASDKPGSQFNGTSFPDCTGDFLANRAAGLGEVIDRRP